MPTLLPTPAFSCKYTLFAKGKAAPTNNPGMVRNKENMLRKTASGMEALCIIAIKINGNKVWVKEDECIGCGICQYSCKHDAIHLVQIGKRMDNLMDYFGGLELDLS